MHNNIILDFIYSKYQNEFYQKFGTSDSYPGLETFYGLSRQRLTKTAELLPDTATSVLDAGSGPGVMLNYFLLNNNYKNVIGIDINISRFFTELSPYQDFRHMSVCDIKFEDNSFELVTCTQVLEHLQTEELFYTALSELRRVSSKTLLVSLPFEEKLPLGKDHFHRFDMAKIKNIFPTGEYTLLDYNGYKHIIIIERFL
jgi:2-polyprenyl-3-methyl-5-hydroxy-6-metoxy-1,4-benzoquinol methylase